MLNPNIIAISNFKLRTDGVVLTVKALPFAFIAAFHNMPDLYIVYPDWPDLTATTYDGTFTFYLDLSPSEQDLIVWDGDLDRGKFDGTDQDTNDPDTPDDVLPDWAVPDTAFKGIAVGKPGTSGNPPDDGKSAHLTRAPSVWYEIQSPDGQVFVNNNPSGSAEWEQFRISTALFDPTVMDYHADSLPPGFYRATLIGLDLQNLDAWQTVHRILGVDENGDPHPPLLPHAIGDTIWYDTDGDGTQDSDEQGIKDVIVNLVDSNGDVIATATTDIDGHYGFEVDADTYTVQVAPENFAGPLAGLQ